MKTDDLIALMTQDTPVGMCYGRVLGIALLAGIALSATLLVVTVGLRPDMMAAAGSVRVLFKLAVTAVLAVLAVRLVMRIGRPGDAVRRPALLLAVPVLMVLVAVSAELAAVPQAAWAASMIGQNALFCLFFIPVLSIAPFGAFFWALRRGAPENPTVAGAAAGLAAGAIAAAVYVWHCPDDSPLFFAVWYTTGMGVATAAGALLGRRWLSW